MHHALIKAETRQVRWIPSSDLVTEHEFKCSCGYRVLIGGERLTAYRQYREHLKDTYRR